MNPSRSRRRKRRRATGPVDDNEPREDKQTYRSRVGSSNVKLKSQEDVTRRFYMHDYICDANWPEKIKISLVNLLSKKWTFQDTVDSDDIDLHEELHDFLFV